MSEHISRSSVGAELPLSEVARGKRNARRVITGRCRRCGDELLAGTRRHAAYCSSACRQAAYRRRAAGLPAGEIVGLADRLADPARWAGQARDNVGSRAHERPIRRARGSLSIDVPEHDHSPRLCATCVAAKHEILRAAPRARISAELVARRIRDDGGSVWGAMDAFEIAYSTAIAIRAGYRGAGRRAGPIPYRSRGWQSGRQNGHSTLSTAHG